MVTTTVVGIIEVVLMVPTERFSDNGGKVINYNCDNNGLNEELYQQKLPLSILLIISFVSSENSSG